MKTLLSLALVTAATASAQQDPQAATSAPMRDVARHEDIAARQQQDREKASTKAVAATESTVDPSKTNKPPSLMSRSEILCFEGIATLVPKRAVINKPKALEDRLTLSDGARLVSWEEFYQANRGWLKTMEVTRKHAEGNEPLSEEATKTLQESSAVIVAVYHSRPISVLPLKPQESVKTEPTPAK
jgi:hypothetical protein